MNVERASIENYTFLNAEGHIIAMHPATRTYTHIIAASNVAVTRSFCCSRKHGIFYVDGSGDTRGITQSHDYDAEHVRTVARLPKCLARFVELNRGLAVKSPDGPV